MVLLFMRFALPAQGFGIGVETAVGPHQVPLADAQSTPPRTERRGVGGFLGPKASVTSACVSRTQRPASRLCHRPHAGGSTRHHHAHRAALLALDTYGMRRRVGLTSIEVSAKHLDQLVLVDRATPQLEIHK